MFTAIRRSPVVLPRLTTGRVGGQGGSANPLSPIAPLCTPAGILPVGCEHDRRFRRARRSPQAEAAFCTTFGAEDFCILINSISDFSTHACPQSIPKLMFGNPTEASLGNDMFGQSKGHSGTEVGTAERQSRKIANLQSHKTLKIKTGRP